MGHFYRRINKETLFASLVMDIILIVVLSNLSSMYLHVDPLDPWNYPSSFYYSIDFFKYVLPHMNWISWIFYLLWLTSLFSLLIRRVHDTGKAFGDVESTKLPKLLIAKSEKQKNKYGTPPKSGIDWKAVFFQLI